MVGALWLGTFTAGLSYLAVGRDRVYQVAVALGLFGVLAYAVSLAGTLNVW